MAPAQFKIPAWLVSRLGAGWERRERHREFVGFSFSPPFLDNRERATALHSFVQIKRQRQRSVKPPRFGSQGEGMSPDMGHRLYGFDGFTERSRTTSNSHRPAVRSTLKTRIIQTVAPSPWILHPVLPVTPSIGAGWDGS